MAWQKSSGTLVAQAKRVDSVIPGAVLLDELFSALNIAHMRVSPFALREGVLQATNHHLPQILPV